MSKRIAVFLLGILMPVMLAAHEVTLFPVIQDRTIHLVVRYGDPGEYEKIATIKLLTLDAASPDQHTYSLFNSVKANTDELGLQALLPLADLSASGTWILTSTYDNGFFVHKADGSALATTLANYPQARDSAHYFKFSKSLVKIGDSAKGYDRVLGHLLELIPHSNPFDPGSHELLLEVRYAGKPLAGAEVEVGDDHAANRTASLKTDSAGFVRVPFDHDGWYRLAVTHRSRSAYPALFQDDDLTASLTFQR